MTMLLPMAMAIHKSLYTRPFLQRKRQPDTKATEITEDLKRTVPVLSNTMPEVLECIVN